MKIYLAGPINGMSDSEANDWRSIVKARFGDYNCLDPMRRDYRGIESQNYREIVDLDKKDIRDCDIFLAMCSKPSYGTSMEIFMAWSIGKIVLSICSGTVSPWVRYHSTRVFQCLDSSIQWIEDNK